MGVAQAPTHTSTIAPAGYIPVNRVNGSVNRCGMAPALQGEAGPDGRVGAGGDLLHRATATAPAFLTLHHDRATPRTLPPPAAPSSAPGKARAAGE